MKRRISNTTFFGLVGVGVFAIIMIFVVFPVGNIFIPTPLNKAIQPNISPNIKNGTIPSGTLINTTKVIVSPTNASTIQNILDSAGCTNNNGVCSASSPKFIININSVILDSSGNQYPSQTYLNIPAQSLLPASLNWITQSLSILSGQKTIPVYSTLGSFLDNVHLLTLTSTQCGGCLLDLGNVQIVFQGTVPADSQVTAFGDYAVYLDDQPRGSGHFAAQGNTVNKAINMQIGGLPALTFTFSNEGANWQNGTQHIFRVMVGNVTATVGSGQNTQSFKMTNTSIAYILVMTLNDEKKVILGADNKAISVFLADDTISACGENANYASSGYSYGSYEISKISPIYNTPLISVSENGFQIISPFQSNAIDDKNSQGSSSAGIIDSGAGAIECVKKEGISRNSIIDVVVGITDYEIKTPRTQFDYKVDCFGSTTPLLNGNQQPQIQGCTNNFGGR